MEKFNGDGGQVSLIKAVQVYYKISPPAGIWHWAKVALKLNALYSQQVQGIFQNLFKVLNRKYPVWKRTMTEESH